LQLNGIAPQTDGPFCSKDSYVFVLSLDGIMKLHPLEPGLNEKEIMSVKDQNGKHFLSELIQIAQTKGSGWVEYLWPKMGETNLSKKKTYVYRVPGTNYAVCSGGYND